VTDGKVVHKIVVGGKVVHNIVVVGEVVDVVVGAKVVDVVVVAATVVAIAVAEGRVMAGGGISTPCTAILMEEAANELCRWDLKVPDACVNVEAARAESGGALTS
jgi:hypothetical protein